MFIDYFYYLRERLPVSVHEYLTLLEALDKGLIRNMVQFYYISRSILCKNEHLFDVYDVAFANFFKDAHLNFPGEIKKQIWDWLEKDINPEEVERFPEEFQDVLGEFDLAGMQQHFEDLLKRQDEEHNLGSQWIGTGGTSEFGHGGRNPMGMRVGGSSGMRTAIQIAHERVFQNYRKDIVLDTRQIKVALKRLRKLDEIGKEDELDLDETIDKTCKNGGDIELVFRKKRKNNVKLLLLMDVGGSMDPYAHLVNRLFSAANQMSHWKDFEHYYFHNCIYEKLFETAQRRSEESIKFDEFLRKYDNSYRVVCVGDQAMASYELTAKYGSIYYYHRNEMPGIYYIKQLEQHFRNHIVWLNPEILRFDWLPWTRKVISSIIPTFDLTVEGIEDAMDYLRKSGKNMYTTVEKLKSFSY
ncbi:MAG: VWA domain-containing protein [Promethearchaeia archaeon]